MKRLEMNTLPSRSPFHQNQENTSLSITNCLLIIKKWNQYIPTYLTPIQLVQKNSHDKPEKCENKFFRSLLNIPRKKALIRLNSSPKFEEGKRQYNELVASYRDTKPVYTNLSKDSSTFEEEHLYKELEEPKQSELPLGYNVANKQASVAYNPPNKSDKKIPQYSEIAPQYPDSLTLYANPNAVGGHVYRELEEPKKTDSLSSPNVIYDKPHCVVESYCHRVRKLSSEVLNPKLVQARVLSDGVVV